MGRRRAGEYRTRAYMAMRAEVRVGDLACWQCGRPASTVDHVPPIATFPDDVPWEGDLLPACEPCNKGHGMTGGGRPAHIHRLGKVTYERR